MLVMYLHAIRNKAVIKKRLYLQICSLFITSLAIFAVLASIAWTLIGHDQDDSDLFLKSAALSEMLIPPIESSQGVQQAALNELHQSLDFDVSLYTESGELLGNAGVLVELPATVNKIKTSIWKESEGGTRWITKLKDGRYLAINLERIQLPGESAVFVIFLGIIAIGIAMIMYPFIRHLSGRLERLQIGVQQIGVGHLDTRVSVEGEDEIAQLAKSFNTAAERIQSLVNAQQLLLANASHELRTPLSRIRLGIEMLEKKSTPSRLQALQVDIAELDILIEELTIMTRIDAGVGERDFEEFDLMGLVAEECSRYENCEFQGNATIIIGDRRMLQRALRNLIDNGFKHGKPPVEVFVHEKNRKITLSVSDDGGGISVIDKDKLFEPFQRGKGKQNVSGSGLGLALVKKITEVHKGSISVKNKPRSIISLTFSL